MNTVNINDFEDQDEYCAALARLPSRTPAQELALVDWYIQGAEESRAEALTQYRSECALFGDAGPGQFAAAHDTREIRAMQAKRATLVRICNNLGV